MDWVEFEEALTYSTYTQGPSVCMMDSYILTLYESSGAKSDAFALSLW
jgi:hypothetical protein